MSTSRRGQPGRDEAFIAKLRSLNFANARTRSRPKVTTDVHDHHKVDVTEHWNDRQDVTVYPQPIRSGSQMNGEET